MVLSVKKHETQATTSLKTHHRRGSNVTHCSVCGCPVHVVQSGTGQQEISNQENAGKKATVLEKEHSAQLAYTLVWQVKGAKKLDKDFEHRWPTSSMY